ESSGLDFGRGSQPMEHPMKTLLGVAVIVALTLGAPAFAYTGQNLARHARISLKRAEAIALHVRPGRITDRDLERERGGSGLRYSFDIRAHGGRYEVGVDARNGRVLEDHREGPNPD